MTSVAKISHDHSVELTLNLLRELTQGDILQRVGVRLWNGTQWPDDELCPTTIVLKHPGALRSMFLPGTEVGLGKAYLPGLAVVRV